MCVFYSNLSSTHSILSPTHRSSVRPAWLSGTQLQMVRRLCSQDTLSVCVCVRERERDKIETLELSFPSSLCLLPFFSLLPSFALCSLSSSFSLCFSLPFPVTSFPESNQSKIVDCGVMEVLVPLLDSRESEIVTAAIAALRNLSIKKGNEVSVSRIQLFSALM